MTFGERLKELRNNRGLELGHEITSNPLLDEYLRREFVPRFNNLKAGLEAILYNKDSDKSDDKSDV